jgi:hypothetical protein
MSATSTVSLHAFHDSLCAIIIPIPGIFLPPYISEPSCLILVLSFFVLDVIYLLISVGLGIDIGICLTVFEGWAVVLQSVERILKDENWKLTRTQVFLSLNVCARHLICVCIWWR